MQILKLSRSFATHSGTFHADEVTACALLLTFDLIDEDKIIRTRDHKKLDCSEFVCDVGGIYDPKIKRFDHHQSDYQGCMSSAGMILLYMFDNEVISKGIFEYLKTKLVDGIDAIDNGLDEPKQGHCSFSMVISNFMPIFYDADESEVMVSFMQAVRFTKRHLKRLIERHEYIQECKVLVEKAMLVNEPFLLIDRSIPWMENFFELGGESHPANFLVMPSRGTWKLRGIPPNLQKRMQVRRPLPKKWAGLLGEDLKKASSIDGAIFCHKGRFISVWETKEDAMKALELILNDKSDL